MLRLAGLFWLMVGPAGQAGPEMWFRFWAELMKKQDVAFEVLKMSRELVLNEHTDRRAQIHNNWLVESEQLWITRRVKLAYPEIPAYPTEAEILARADKLMKFLYTSENIESEPESASAPMPPLTPAPEPEPVPELQAVAESEPDTQAGPDPEPARNETQKKTQLGLLPAVMKKLDELGIGRSR